MHLIASDCVRYGILGQFGPDRKLQLLTTNLSAIVGWDGRLLANASIEMEVFVSNASHVLHVFEYTKENNVKGVQFLIPQPPGGWRASTWHSFTIPTQVPRGPLTTSDDLSWPLMTSDDL